MDDHTLKQVINLAVKTVALKAKMPSMAECVCMGAHCLEWGCANG